MKVEDLGAPMDVLWFRLSRKPGDPLDPMGRFTPGRITILINRGDYWQCAFIIRKGAFEATRSTGLPEFRRRVAQIAPMLADRDGQELDRRGRPARALAPARPALHRRRRPRDVADRRRRRQ